MTIEKLVLLHARRTCNSVSSRSMSILPTSRLMAMKAGTPIAGLDFLKNADAPVTKERSEYPSWIDDLSKPMKTLAKLGKLDFEKAEEVDQMRLLKLSRRKEIKGNNIDAGLS